MAIGIDPTIDFAFKRLLGNPDHPAITIHFLNAILAGEPTITSVEFLNPFVEKDFEEDKLSILDILARDARGRLVNIEVQTAVAAALPERLAFYVGSLFVGQLSQGESYQRLKPAIGICVLDGILFAKQPDLHLDFRFRSRDATVSLTNHLQIHLIELPKYRPPLDNGPITDPVEQWVYFFRQAQGLTPEQVAQRLGSPVFAEATGVLEMIARTPRERELYEARLKLHRDEQAKLEAARDQGLAEGEEKGRAEGRAVGEMLGRVRLLHELLGRQEPTGIDSQPYEELASLERQLQDELRNRG